MNQGTALKTEAIIPLIEKGFKDGVTCLELDSCHLTLLPFGQSYQKQNASHTILVYEDLFIKNQGFYHSLISSKLGLNKTIYGRETDIRVLSKADFTQFCNEFHYLKSTNTKVRFGLYHQEELVMVCGFSKPRKMYRDDKQYRSAELIRSCTKFGLTVTGGLSKLINQFVQQEKPDDIITYIDKDFFSGKGFEALGFKLYKELPPSLTWLDKETGDRFTSDQLMKRGKLQNDEYQKITTYPKGFIPMQNTGNKKMVQYFANDNLH